MKTGEAKTRSSTTNADHATRKPVPGGARSMPGQGRATFDHDLHTD